MIAYADFEEPAATVTTATSYPSYHYEPYSAPTDYGSIDDDDEEYGRILMQVAMEAEAERNDRLGEEEDDDKAASSTERGPREEEDLSMDTSGA